MYAPWRPDAGPPRPPTREPPVEGDGLALGAGFLALGSFLLFVASGFAFPGGGYGLIFFGCALFLPAVVLHAAAWWILGRAAVRHALDRPGVFGAFVASLVLFGLAIWTLVGGMAPLRHSEFGVLFPILPWVWAPVVLAHAVLFASASAHLPDPRARSWAHAGIFILASLAAIALLDEVRIVDLGLGVLTFAGWTFVGYLFLASSFQGTALRPARVPAYPPVRGVAA